MLDFALNLIYDVVEKHKENVVQLYIENKDKINKVCSFFEDEDSREKYIRELAFMAIRKMFNEEVAIKYAGNVTWEEWRRVLKLAQQAIEEKKVPAINFGTMREYWTYHTIAATYIFEQYSHPPYVIVRDGDVVLDCGACIGDTSLWFLSKGAKKVYAFEPAPGNFNLLTDNFNRLAPPRLNGEVQVELVRLALGDMHKTVNFEQAKENLGISKVSQDGQFQVEMVTLDAYCAEHFIVPTFIKMDLEGGEVGAITGAKHIISEYKPRLAICLYHSMQDMWEIPILLKEICPEYKFWCRKNAHCAEFVLYAV